MSRKAVRRIAAYEAQGLHKPLKQEESGTMNESEDVGQCVKHVKTGRRAKHRCRRVRRVAVSLCVSAEACRSLSTLRVADCSRDTSP